jgi:hypothetical protein
MNGTKKNYSSVSAVPEKKPDVKMLTKQLFKKYISDFAASNRVL